jgi:ribosomal protein S18 acetylase RimI-like enzyme
MPDVVVRPATAADFDALTKLDLTYTVGDRYLALERSGSEQEPAFSLSWREGTAREAVYDTLTVDGLRDALDKHTDAFFVAELSGAIIGYLMIIKLRFTNAAEVTDLAIDRQVRRSGAGRALVDAAAAWARERELRGLGVEPRGEAGHTIDFYLSLGFRISGHNDRWATGDDGIDGRQTVFMYLDLT